MSDSKDTPETAPQPDSDNQPLIFDLSGGDFPGLMQIVHEIRTDAAACEDPTARPDAEEVESVLWTMG